MKRVIGLIVVYLTMAQFSVIIAQSLLRVEIVNLESNKGNVIVDLLDKQEKSVMDTTIQITDYRCSIIFNNVKNNIYAIRYFHDENQNKELDTNILGIPKEGFGFSNDALGRFGPKDFSEWLFEVSGYTEIRMTTKYFK